MDALKAEIARKRKVLETATDVVSGTGSTSKYYKKGDLEAKLAGELRKSHLPDLQSEERSSDRDSSPDISSSKTKTRGDGVRSGAGDYGEEVRLPRKEVVRRLRERNEPVRLFGESDEDSMKRLKTLEIQEPELNVGFRNDFKAAMDKIDQEVLNDLAKGESSSKKNTTDIKITYDGTTLEAIAAESPEIRCASNKLTRSIQVHLASKLNTYISDLLTVYLQYVIILVGQMKGSTEDANQVKLAENPDKSPNVTREVISKFIKFMMRRWAEELNRRPPEIKTTDKGKLDRVTYVQTEDYLKSLFQKLRTNSLQDDISENLFRIIKYSLEGEYVRANEVFLQMAIGNAPWPIGVTAVGIHSRPGREKVFSQMIAHVLNDETQRKYIQGFKRLMTKMQQLYPGDPSKSVEYRAVAPLTIQEPQTTA